MKSPLAGLVLDRYDRRARLAPALIVALPVGLAIVTWFPSGFRGLATAVSIGAWCGVTLLAANMGRDMGKQREPRLFARWGGKPTTRLLRHRDAPNHTLLERQHELLSALVPEPPGPSREEERADPARADEVYELWTAVLRERTRDTTKFPLLFAENCSYGFRRNLWGMKPLGITTALIGGAAGVAKVWLTGPSDSTAPLAATCAGACTLLLLGWLFWFRDSWVRIPAEAYAERLLAALEYVVPDSHPRRSHG